MAGSFDRIHAPHLMRPGSYRGQASIRRPAVRRFKRAKLSHKFAKSGNALVSKPFASPYAISHAPDIRQAAP